MRVCEWSNFGGVGTDHLFPNVARSQLRHTPIFIQFFLFLRGSGTNCGQTRFLRFFEILQSAENPHK